METSILKRSVLAGIAGTIAMTIFASMAPMMGMPEMNIPKMLAGTMGLPVAIGWAMHFMIGIVLALIYGKFFSTKLPGSYLVRGMIFSILPWMLAQIMVMPMMAVMNNMPFTSGIFSGSLIMAMGSLMGHMVFGGVLGFTYGQLECQEASCQSISSVKIK
jgi:uncharacterized membrane protein YagU involved in acid resistance